MALNKEEHGAINNITNSLNTLSDEFVLSLLSNIFAILFKRYSRLVTTMTLCGDEFDVDVVLKAKEPETKILQ